MQRLRVPWRHPGSRRRDGHPDKISVSGKKTREMEAGRTTNMHCGIQTVGPTINSPNDYFRIVGLILNQTCPPRIQTQFFMCKLIN